MKEQEQDKQTFIRPLRSITLLALGLLTGIIAGYGAVVFRMMISFFHNLLFYGQFNLFL